MTQWLGGGQVVGRGSLGGGKIMVRWWLDGVQMVVMIVILLRWSCEGYGAKDSNKLFYEIIGRANIVTTG